jgi:hypothetical protein
MFKRNVGVVVPEVSKLNIHPVSTPGRRDKNLDLSSFDSAEKEKMAVKV